MPKFSDCNSRWMLRLQLSIAGEKSKSMMDDVDTGKTSLPHTVATECFSSQQNTLSPSMKPLSFYLHLGVCWSEKEASLGWSIGNDKVTWQPLNRLGYTPSCHSAVFIAGGWWMSDKKKRITVERKVASQHLRCTQPCAGESPHMQSRQKSWTWYNGKAHLSFPWWLRGEVFAFWSRQLFPPWFHTKEKEKEREKTAYLQ